MPSTPPHAAGPLPKPHGLAPSSAVKQVQWRGQAGELGVPSAPKH